MPSFTNHVCLVGLILILEVSIAPAQTLSLWKDAEGITHIGEKPPTDTLSRQIRVSPTAPPTAPQPQASPAEERELSPSTEPATPEGSASGQKPDQSATAQTAPGVTDDTKKHLEERKLYLEDRLHRARVRGDRRTMVRARHQLELNRKALEELEQRP